MLLTRAEKVTEFTEFEEIDGCLDNLEDLNEKKPSVECLCPKCGKIHSLTFLWTGRGTPRKYCHRCREIIAGVSTQGIYETSPDAFRFKHSGIRSLD